MAPTSPSPGASTPDPLDTAVPDLFPAFLVSGSGDGLTAGVTTLTVNDLPAGEVLIEVSWSAVNYKDGMVTRPGNRVARTSPLVPGVDLVGTVVTSSDPAFAFCSTTSNSEPSSRRRCVKLRKKPRATAPFR